MDLKSGLPYWLIQSGLPYNYPKLAGHSKTAVVIIGGGISGALTAWHLCNSGIEAMLVDRRTIGLGSTCASTSLLQYELDIPFVKLAEICGKKKAVYAYTRSREALRELKDIAIQTGFAHLQSKESLYYAASQKDVKLLEKEYAARKKAGLEVQLLDRHDIHLTFGINAPAALLSAEAAQTNAYLLTHHLLQQSMQKGLRVFDRTAVTDIIHEKNNILLHTEDGYTISARKVVFATGYESVHYIREPVVHLHSTFATAGEHADDARDFWHRNALIWNTADPYLYLRVTEDHRIIIGGRDEKYNNPEKRDKHIPAKTKQLCKDFRRLFPQIDFSPEFSWAGTFGTTDDSLPYVAEYAPMPDCYFALGFGGNGIIFSQIAASVITDLIRGKHNNDSKIFGFDR
jgi:glycine/D-amino acid oxidase-like deaminating enzyme